MLDGREDQATGLRRLFRRAPPAVVALYATGRQRAYNAVHTAHRIAGLAERVLLLDEATGEDALAGVLGVPPGHDLLQMLDGRLTLAELVQPVPGLFGRVSAGAAALALPLLDDTRRACLVEAMRVLHRHAGFVLIHTVSAADPSPFVLAAPRRLLVAEVSATGATESYQTIKQLAAAGAGSVHVAACRAPNRAEAKAFFGSLEALVRRHVGVPLSFIGEVERDDLAAGLKTTVGPASAQEPETTFLRRLAAAGGQGMRRA